MMYLNVSEKALRHNLKTEILLHYSRSGDLLSKEWRILINLLFNKIIA
ncbi:protein of unknown function [Vibrio tapetis subsp. tapetis]|uniref:Uncharacterized protein n=1 Tax=Vibrio tapetis subsp. tapetis TaxID=1671868 RepID=A0A2N8ZFP6_9VIBR|nr:protein of unknown function [Vibrio tapetis subsp. tapetis]